MDAPVDAPADSPVTILYFAWLRERLGTASEAVRLAPEVRTVDDLVRYLSGERPAFAEAMAGRPAVRCAVNQEFARFSDSISPGDEIAFFPPVTGG